MRYYTDKYLCQIADAAFVELATLDSYNCVSADNSFRNQYDEEIASIVKQYEDDASRRESSDQLIQFCSDARKYFGLINTGPECESYEAVDVIDSLLDFVRDCENFSEGDRARALLMMLDIISLESASKIIGDAFENYAFCRMLFMFTDEERPYYDRFEARRCSERLLNADPKGVYGLIANLTLAKLSESMVKVEKYLRTSIAIIESVIDGDDIRKKWYSRSLVALLLLDDQIEDMFADVGFDSKDTVLECTSLIPEVCSSSEYEDYFKDEEPLSRDYVQSLAYLVLPIELGLESMYTSMRDKVLDVVRLRYCSVFDLSACLLYVYEYAIFRLRGVRSALDAKALLEIGHDIDGDSWESTQILLNAILEHNGVDSYKESPEHKELSEKAEIGSKLDRMDVKLDNMANVLDAILSKVDGVEDLGARLEEIVSRTFSAEIQKLNLSIRQSGNGVVLDGYRGMFERELGAVWTKASELTRNAVITAAYYLGTMPEGDDYDARGICICSTVALEQELSLIFHDEWYRYLQRRCSRWLSPWPDRWCLYDNSDDRRRKSSPRPFEDTDFTLGTMPYIFGWKDYRGDYDPPVDRRSGNPAIDDFVRLHYDVDDPFGWFTAKDGILDEIDEVRVKYRNPAAHPAPIAKPVARTGAQVILGLSEDLQAVNNQGLLWRILSVKK